MSEWTPDRPSRNGAYLWRRDKDEPYQMHAIYHVEDGRCMTGGGECDWPRGGEWRKIE